MDSRSVPMAWIWINKPKVLVIPAPLEPMPEPWTMAFRTRAEFLGCSGATTSGRPCRRCMYRWHIYSTHETFSAYCASHQDGHPHTQWRVWDFAETIRCPCGCEAAVTVEGRALAQTTHAPCTLWEQAVDSLGPAQWVTPTSEWTARIGVDSGLIVEAGIAGGSESTAYRDWLCWGPPSWPDFPDGNGETISECSPR